MRSISLYSFFEPHRGGVSTYLEILKKALVIGSEYELQDTVLGFPLNFFQKVRAVFRMILGFGAISLREAILSERMAHYLRKLKDLPIPNILHFQDPIAFYVFESAYGADLGRRLTVLTVHGPLSREAKMMHPTASRYIRKLKEIEQKAYENADRIICVDTGQMKILEEDYSIAIAKMKVIINPIDIEEILRIPPLKLKLNNPKAAKSFQLVIPRRLVKKNGVDVAIRAIPYIDYDVQLLILGDGPERSKLESLVDELGVRDSVIFLGDTPRKKVLGYIRHSDAVLIPSVPCNGVIEASSLAALEGMAASKVVIASNIGGLKEMIVHLHNGILFEHGSFKDLAKAIGRLISMEQTQKSSIEEAGFIYAQSKDYKNWIKSMHVVYAI